MEVSTMKSEFRRGSQRLEMIDRAAVNEETRQMIEEISAVRVIAEARDELEAARLIAEYKPNLVFLDISMPSLSGTGALAQIAKDLPGISIVIMTSQKDEKFAVQARYGEAAGLLSATAVTSRRELAMETVMNRNIFRSPIAGRSPERDDGNDASTEHSLFDPLTRRQHEVLRLVAEGYSTKQIAVKLCISAKTVETHRAQLMERLDIHDVAGLVRYALKERIVSIDLPPVGWAKRV